MLITDYNWELVAANLSHKQVLFDYAEAAGVTIGNAGEANGETSYRDDSDLAIGYSEGLMSYHIGAEDSSSFDAITPAQFLEMCDAYANTIYSTLSNTLTEEDILNLL